MFKQWNIDMTKIGSHGMARGLAMGLMALGSLLVVPGSPANAAEPYTLKIEGGSGKVGEKASLVATVTLADGYRFLESYNNRIIMLSSFDDGVAFDREVVRGSVKDGGLVFVVPVTATKPGEHPINGVFRIGYAEGAHTMKMISLPLMAKVTGAD